MLRLLILAFGVVLAITACGPTLRPDPNPYAIDSNVPTAEIVACGERVLGLKACAIERGRPLSGINLIVQGYNNGVVRVSSDACGVDESKTYTDSEPVELYLPGMVENNCLLAISVLPEFPNERDSGIVIGALKAFVRVRMIDHGQEWHGYSSKVSEAFDVSLVIPKKSGVLSIRGCGTSIDQNVNGSHSLFSIPTPQEDKSCVYEGVLIPDEGEPILMTWLVWRYAKNYIPSSVPAIQLDEGCITITGEPATTVVAVDKDYSVDRAASFSFDKTKPHIVRTLTVAGRNVLGVYEPGKGFKWKQ